jgi:hypothetical protein
MNGPTPKRLQIRVLLEVPADAPAFALRALRLLGVIRKVEFLGPVVDHAAVGVRKHDVGRVKPVVNLPVTAAAEQDALVEFLTDR